MKGECILNRRTNLRALRLRYDIPLSELSAVSGLSNQYISRAELGELSPTPLLEDKLGAAVGAVIIRRSGRLSALERGFTACKGSLLQLGEVEADE